MPGGREKYVSSASCKPTVRVHQDTANQKTSRKESFCEELQAAKKIK